MCGGGKNVDVYQNAFSLAGQEFVLRKLNLPVPENVRSPTITESNFDRVAVAYGLSFSADDLGKICRRTEVDDVRLSLRQASLEERSISKDQV
jgi:hypothetical protein